MIPTIKDSREITTHQDGTVSLWDVYRRQWVRLPIDQIGSRILATLTNTERLKISKGGQ